MKNSTIIVIGGGTSGWVSALYFLNKSKELNLGLKIKLISSNDIEPIGVGEGTTPIFTNFIENLCKIDKKEFLKETKGSFKYGIKFDNWNFDQEYYYHLFSDRSRYDFNATESKDLDYIFLQHVINNDYNIPQEIIQKKMHGVCFDLIENNKVSLNINDNYSYHFSAKLIIELLRKKCLEFTEFEHIKATIKGICYKEDGYIKNIVIEDENSKIDGDFFINCLGFNSMNILNEEYFDIEYWDEYILNNSAFAMQVKNSSLENLEPYTTSTAQEYGWSWKIPQYEKTGYGYVYSDHFINDEDKLYDDIIKTYSIKEKDIFKTKVVKSKPYCNRKQIHKNCLSIGLSSGFVEPLEATSIHMSLISLNRFFDIVESEIEFNQKHFDIFNKRQKKEWDNIFKFIIFHYFTNNPTNDYWKHYKKIQENDVFDFYEKYNSLNILKNSFSRFSYLSVGLGLRIKDYWYGFTQDKILSQDVYDYLKIENHLNTNSLYSLSDIMIDLHQNNINTKK